MKRVAYLEDLLANPPKILALVRDELAELKKKFGDPAPHRDRQRLSPARSPTRTWSPTTRC